MFTHGGISVFSFALKRQEGDVVVVFLYEHLELSLFYRLIASYLAHHIKKHNTPVFALHFHFGTPCAFVCLERETLPIYKGEEPMSGMQGIYLLTSRMQTQMKKMDASAVNVANANTNGFKRQEVDFQTIIGGQDARPAGKFVEERGFRNVFEQGAINQTGNPLDVALMGNGFFAVEKGGGQAPAYTRDGHFNLTPDGVLVNQQGEPILGEDNAQIQLPTDAILKITVDGSITANGEEVAQIGVFQFPPEAGLIRIGGNQFRLEDGLPPVAAEDVRVLGGAVESSNVNPIMETIKLQEVSQAYQGAARLMNRLETIQERAIRELPRMSSN